MEAFAAMDELFGAAATKQQQKQQHFGSKINSSALALIDKSTGFEGHQILSRYASSEVEEDEEEARNEPDHEQFQVQQQQQQLQQTQQQEKNQQEQQQQQLQGCLSPKVINNNINSNNASSLAAAADQADSKDACKDAGSWSTHATSVLLDVFKEKRMAINGRNFRGEEWEELATGVNERCHGGANFVNATSTSGNASAAKEQWKNAKQCSYKMSNLKRKYKSEKEMMQLSGSSALSSWQWFAKMEAIFAQDPKYASLGGAHTKLEALHGDLFDEEIVNNNANHNSNMNNNNNQGQPASKSASTNNNLDGCSPSPSRQQQDMAPVESSPRSLSGDRHVKKKQCLGNTKNTSSPMSDLVPPAGFADSIKLMLVQQKETIQLLRELVSFKTQHRHEQENPPEFANRRDVLELKLKIESTDRELMHLKFMYETKERELREAMVAYEDKCREVVLLYRINIATAISNISRAHGLSTFSDTSLGTRPTSAPRVYKVDFIATQRTLRTSGIASNSKYMLAYAFFPVSSIPCLLASSSGKLFHKRAAAVSELKSFGSLTRP